MKQGALFDVAGSVFGGSGSAPTPQPSPRCCERFWIFTQNRGGEGVNAGGPGPRAAVASLPCPGLPSYAPLGLKVRLP